MTNFEVAKRFFTDFNGICDRKYMTVSYQNNIFYSYNTAIAKIVKDINGNNVLIVSYENFSRTTSKHLRGVLNACSDHGYNRYYFFHDYNRRDFYPSWILNDIKANLEYYSNEKLTQKKNREGLAISYNMLSNTLILEDFRPYFEEIKALLKQYKATYEEAQKIEKLRQLKKAA